MLGIIAPENVSKLFYRNSDNAIFATDCTDSHGKKTKNQCKFVKSVAESLLFEFLSAFYLRVISLRVSFPAGTSEDHAHANNNKHNGK
jgi:hypothetical protein